MQDEFFPEVTWQKTYSPDLEKNVTEVVPTSLRQNNHYIEVYNHAYLQKNKSQTILLLRIILHKLNPLC